MTITPRLYRYATFCTVFLFVLTSCTSLQSHSKQLASALPKQLQDRQIIVTLAPATPEVWAHLTEQIKLDYRLEEFGNFPLNSIGVQCLVFRPLANQPLETIIAKLAQDPRIESVQANVVFSGMQGHSDPYASLQYGANVIGAVKAHRNATGKDIKIAIIDTGVDINHPDLQNSVLQTKNFVDGGDSSFTTDQHGTAVAGVIAAQADNDMGIFGIAPEAQIIALKSCWYANQQADKALCSSWTLAKAIDFAISSKANIINLSLAGPPDKLLERLLKVAHEQGIHIIAAVADKNPETPGFPAALDFVIAVLASDTHNKVTLPKWNKPTNLLAAPGIEILTTYPGAAYDFASGSSIAAAHVSGIVALLLEHQADLKPTDLARLLNTTQPIKLVNDHLTAKQVTVIDICHTLKSLNGDEECS